MEKIFVNSSHFKRKHFGDFIYCKKCKERKHKDKFPRSIKYMKNHTKVYPYSPCKDCTNIYMRKRRLEFRNATGYQDRYTPARQFGAYVRSAKKRNYVFELNIEYFKQLSLKSCYYCGIKFCDGNILGVDRVNSKIGYIYSNCVACCSDCNMSKQKMTERQYIKHCEKVYKYNLTKTMTTLPVKG